MEYRKFTDDAEEFKNSLAAERDRYEDESRNFDKAIEEKAVLLNNLHKVTNRKDRSTQNVSNDISKR